MTGDVHITHASGEGSTAAGRDAATGGSTVGSGHAQVATADHGAAASTGRSRATVTAPPKGEKRKRLAAAVFFVVGLAVVGLAFAGVLPPWAAALLVAFEGAICIGAYRLLKGL